MDLTVFPTDDRTEDVLSADDLTDDDLPDEDLTDDDSGLFTDDIDDLELRVLLLKLDDLVVDADDEPLLNPAPLLDLVMEELLTPALLDAEPIPPLLPDPVVDRRGVYTLPLPGPKKSRS